MVVNERNRNAEYSIYIALHRKKLENNFLFPRKTVA